MFLKMAKYTTREHYLVSCLTRLDLTKEENMLFSECTLWSSWIQTCETGDQTYSDTSPGSQCSLIKSKLDPENTHLLRKGKYHCTADLLFDRLGFGQTSKSVYSFNSTKQLNPNQSNRRSAVQWYFPLQSNWVFSAWSHYSNSACYQRLTERVKPSRIGHFFARVKRGQLDDFLSYCVNAHKLPRSEQALMQCVAINWKFFYFYCSISRSSQAESL